VGEESVSYFDLRKKKGTYGQDKNGLFGSVIPAAAIESIIEDYLWRVKKEFSWKPPYAILGPGKRSVS